MLAYKLLQITHDSLIEMCYFICNGFWWASLPTEIEAGLPGIGITRAKKAITNARKFSAQKSYKTTKSVSEGINIFKKCQKLLTKNKIKIMCKQFHFVSRFHGITTVHIESMPTKKPRSPTQLF